MHITLSLRVKENTETVERHLHRLVSGWVEQWEQGRIYHMETRQSDLARLVEWSFELRSIRDFCQLTTLEIDNNET